MYSIFSWDDYVILVLRSGTVHRTPVGRGRLFFARGVGGERAGRAGGGGHRRRGSSCRCPSARPLAVSSRRSVATLGARRGTSAETRGDREEGNGSGKALRMKPGETVASRRCVVCCGKGSRKSLLVTCREVLPSADLPSEERFGQMGQDRTLPFSRVRRWRAKPAGEIFHSRRCRRVSCHRRRLPCARGGGQTDSQGLVD